MTNASPTPDQTVDVLIVGGGGAGLTASMLLTKLGVDHLLVSALPTTSTLPKAHVLNQRTMEILDDAGVAAAIAKRSTPAANMAASAFYAGLAGPGDDYGRRIAKIECWGAGKDDENWRAASAWHQLNPPQIRLEPILKDHAEELAPGRIRFSHELTALEQDAEGVTATIRDLDAGSDYAVRCRYLIGADGGRTVPGLVGISHVGLGVVTQTATMHVSADFSQLAQDDDVLLRWLVSPQTGVSVVMVPMGPERWGRHSEEWVIHINYPADDPRAQSDEKVESDVRASLGIPGLPMEVHKITRWSVEAVMADRYSDGRVILAGDAAHRHPPTGGLGLTSGIQDVHNLTWKLAAVIHGQAGAQLLDTYEPERRPSLERNAQRSLENAVNHFGVITPSLGVSHEQTEEENIASFRRLWSGLPEDAEHRAAVLRAIRSQSMEFSEHNVEYGYTYASAAIVPDGSPAPESPDEIRVYQPSTRPGAPLPHAWIDDEDGVRRPIKDLVAPGRFLLIAGEEGEAWCAAARELAARDDIPLDAVRIGHIDGDLFDPRCTRLRHSEIGADGAILVRPDRFVAWRSLGDDDDPAGALAEALSQVLARPVTAAVPA
ncbi:MAG TPA: FAD-dependent monooxygenase [Solirubrobacteraceae bacterium]|nr:FAD-dependent monooxygenase [Solirubrobacteraceae bacterium]